MKFDMWPLWAYLSGVNYDDMYNPDDRPFKTVRRFVFYPRFVSYTLTNKALDYLSAADADENQQPPASPAKSDASAEGF